MKMNLPCSECKNNIKYANQLGLIWPRMGYACCVKCWRKKRKFVTAKKSID